MPEAVANNIFDAPTPGTDMLVAVVIGRWHLLSEPPRPGSDASVIWKGLSLASGLLSHVMHDHGEALWLPPDPIGISSRNIWDILPLLANVVGTSGGQPSRFPDWQVRMSHALGNNGQLDPILVRVCPALAVAVAMNLWKILHVVPFAPGSVPWRRLLQHGPAPPHLREFAKELTPRLAAQSEHPAQGSRRQLESEMPVRVILEWLDASRDLKAIRDSNKAVDKFAKIIGRHLNLNPTSLVGELKRAPYNMLRKARIKVDCVAMLLWRLFWSRVRLTSLCLYLWIDASPQRRGLEFLATSWDVFTVGAFRFRRKLPAIRLQRALFSASGRTTAMLWQIFLLVGPCARTFRIILASIRSITTDMGVESKIYEAADTSIMFLRYLGVAIPRDVQPIQFLLPNCLQIPGWKHKADLWIKRGLSRCRVPRVVGELQGARLLRSRREHEV